MTSIAQRIKAARNRTFSVDIATELGVNAAIFLGQLDYWLQHMGKEIDGEVWIYSTFENWTAPANFPFWSEKTVKRIVADLRNQGIIVTTDEHNKMPMDKTLWYSIPGWAEHQDIVSRPSGQVVPPTSGQVVPSNNHKITHEKTPPPPAAPNGGGGGEKSSTDDLRKVYAMYENNFGLLTPIIAECIGASCGEYPTAWIIEAMGIAVKSNKRKWNYVEGILRKWHADGKQGKPTDAQSAEQPKTKVQMVLQDGVYVAQAVAA